MTMRITGMVSGLDTETIIGELTKAYKGKTEKYEKANTKLEWKEDAWKSLNTKIYDLYKNVSNLRFTSAYTTQKATVSDASKATVSADGSAANGTQTLNVISTAQSAYLTGSKLSKKSGDGDLDENSAMSDLGYTGESTAFNVKTTDADGNETTTKINVTKDSSIKDVVNQLKDAGLKASFDAKNSRIFVMSKTTGEKGNFEFEAVTGESGSTSNSKAMLENLGLSEESGFFGSEITDSSGNVATDATTLAELGFNVSEEHSFTVKIPGKDDKEITVSGSTSIGDVVQQLKDAGLSGVKFEDGKLSITGSTPEVSDEFSIVATSGDSLTGRVMQLLGINEEEATIKNGAVKMDGTDAKIRLNGATYTNNTNDFKINGLSITATGVTGDGSDKAISVNTATDTQVIYDKVKDFLKEYNTLINEMTSLYNADSSKGYEPLTDDEKSEMSDTEIQKWEKKIKDSLLRRDSTLESVMSAMTTSMFKSYNVNGKSCNLTTFGIHTLGFLNSPKNEQKAFHIDGDEDDSNTSGLEDKLMAAIKDDPDTVIDFMKQLTSGLYTAIDGKMKSTSLSSAYTVYNDKDIKNQKNEYAKVIKKWEKKATEQEDYYYKKFGQMEKALAEMQSQTQNLTGLFGS